MLTALLKQLDILLRRAREEDRVSGAERLVREAECLLEERFATPVTVKEIAQELGVSYSSLHTSFVKLRGSTPKAYMQQLRVQHALTMLGNASLTLEAVAQLCGYHSASHLSRHVKSMTGRSPGTFRATANGQWQGRTYS
jgi:transcriptional regulator GlxA family with amidase domain